MNIADALSLYDVTNRDDLEMLYDNKALTYEGLALESIEHIVEYIIDSTDVNHVDVYVTPGSVMNEVCELKGKNAYPGSLHIVSFMPTGSLVPSLIGARWMDDIINTNADLEAYHPFNEYYFEEFEAEAEIEDEFYEEE